MRTVDIPNHGIKVWMQKNELPLDNYLHSLTKREIKRQRPFKLMEIDHDQIKDETRNDGMC